MKLVGLQFDIQWRDKAANFRLVKETLEERPPDAGSLIVLPEMFATGFDMDVEAIAEEEGGKTEKFLSELAKCHQSTVVGGVVSKGEDGRGLNQAVAFSAGGQLLARYTKIKPFTMGGETEVYSAGKDITFLEWNGFKTALFVCYDLRFPELMREATRQGAEIMVFIASWPSARHLHWAKLLQARAIENQCYVVGVNRVGTDPSFSYVGRSAIINFDGNELFEAGANQRILSAPVYRKQLLDYRERLPFLADM